MIDFALNDEQKILQRSVREFFEANYPTKLARSMIVDSDGYSRELWHKMASLGWMGLALSEEYGGSGGSFLDLCVLYEEWGRACLVDPFFSTVILGAETILQAGNQEQKQRLLPKVVSGDLTFTLALTEHSEKYDPYSVRTSARIDGTNYIIDGVKLFVENAHVADYTIVVASSTSRHTEEVTLFLIDNKPSSMTLTPLKTISGDKQFEVAFNRVKVPKENILGTPNQGNIYLKKVLDKATVVKCIEMLGNAEKVMEISVTYAKERVQFGRPIGSNQAIQWLCADNLIDIRGARYLIYQTAWKLQNGLVTDFDISSAKAWISDVLYRVCIRAHEIFGAIGFTEDHDLPLYTKRAKTQELAFGDGRYHRRVIAKTLGLGGDYEWGM